MKKIFIMLIILTSVSSLNAQFIRYIGIKGGVTSSTQTWQGTMADDMPQSKTGLNIGMFAEFLNLSFLSFVAEANYVEKGYKFDIYATSVSNPDGGQLESHKYGYNYLNFSLLGKLKLDYPVVSPYLIAGPKIDILLNNSIDGNIIIFPDDKLNSVRFGFKAGVGAETKLFGLIFLAEFIYDFEIGSLYNYDTATFNTHSLDFRIGAAIGL